MNSDLLIYPEIKTSTKRQKKKKDHREGETDRSTDRPSTDAD